MVALCAVWSSPGKGGDSLLETITFAHRLRAARRKAGLSQASLLKRVGRRGASNISGWERGQIPEIDTLCRLAVELNVTLDWLLGVDELRSGRLAIGAEAPPDPVPLDEVLVSGAPVLWRGSPIDHRMKMAIALNAGYLLTPDLMRSPDPVLFVGESPNKAHVVAVDPASRRQIEEREQNATNPVRSGRRGRRLRAEDLGNRTPADKPER